MNPTRLDDGIRSALAEFFLDGRNPASLRVSQSGVLVEAGGDLAHHGLEGLEVGAPILPQVDYLDGLLHSSTAPYLVPAVQIRPGKFADLCLIPTGGEITVLLLDATDLVESHTELVHKGNELDLLRERLQGEDTGGDLREVLAALGVVLFERDRPNVLRARMPVPRWFPPLLDLVDVVDVDRIDTRELDATSFLGNFVIDSERFWIEGGRGSLRSGVWTEAALDGSELFLEAFAIADGRGQAWLGVELLSNLYEERRMLLQRARETLLDFDLLRGEIEKKEVLLHCIVHDLKGPLASIVGVLSLLRRRALDATRTEELLDLALRQAHRQDHRIRGVLEVFSAEVEALRGWEPDPRHAPDLCKIATEGVERARPAYLEADIELEVVNTLKGPCQVRGRVQRLERVLENLLENARRYSPVGSVTRVQVERLDDVAVLRVIDHGPGVEPDMTTRLFDRFASGSSGGSAGLGLFFCRITVERWGGRIHHSQTPGGGATFTVELPFLPNP